MKKNYFLFAAVVAGVLVARAETKVGIIGVDTGHAVAFTKMMNVDKDPDVAGFRVTHAYKWGSKDIKSCTDRYATQIPQLEGWGVRMVDSIAELLENVDCVLLESCDGRPHLEQALEVFRSGKPCYIDKPIAADLKDALKILDAAKAMGQKVFCSSSLRYTKAVKEAVRGDYGKIRSVNTFAPGNFEPTHSDFFWYAIHGAEPLFAIMGTGCEEVTCVHTDSDDVIVGRWKDGRLGVERVFATRGGYGGAVINEKSQLFSLGGYEGYKVLLVEILEYFRTGKEPIAPEETREIYAFLDAARLSKERGGKPVTLAEAIDLAK